jgi:hypothetical protein
MLINKQFHKKDMNVVNFCMKLGTTDGYNSGSQFATTISHNPWHNKTIQQYLDFYRAYTFITYEILQQPQHLKWQQKWARLLSDEIKSQGNAQMQKQFS